MRRWASAFLVLLAVSSVRGQSALLDRAADRAIAYDASSLEWTCDEWVRRVRYDGDGQATRESIRSYALLMVTDPEDRGAVELTAPLNSGKRGTEQPLAGLSGFPPVTSWLRLFHPDTRPWVLIRDVGAADASETNGHPFAFRGAWAFEDGSDLREWEGTAWVDPGTGDLLRVEAVPSSQTARIEALIDRRNRRSIPVNIFGFRFTIGPTAHGRYFEAAFAQHAAGFWLPTRARLETFDAVAKHTPRPLRAAVVTLEQCRRFETAALSDERSRASALKTRRP
jgi:hypothetical protein